MSVLTMLCSYKTSVEFLSLSPQNLSDTDADTVISDTDTELDRIRLLPTAAAQELDLTQIY